MEKNKKQTKKNDSKKSQTSSSSFSLMFGKQKLSKGQKKYKNYIKSLKLFKNKNIRANIVYLYELTIRESNEIKQKYDIEVITLGQRKTKIFLECYNKIREIINSNDLDFIDKYIFEEDRQLYRIEDKKEKISINESNIIENNKKVKINNDNKEKDKNIIQENHEISPIKKFWKISLINSQFFYISKRDAEILNYLQDIIFIPLDYPNFKIEFHFIDNEYFNQKILYKEYYYTNYKKEKLIKSMGCDIDWEEDENNPTLKVSKKKMKELKEMKYIKNQKNKKAKVKEESIYVNCNSFFNMFDIDKCTIEKDLNEANFIVNDFLPNILEYYLNIIEIQYEKEEDELLSNK